MIIPSPKQTITFASNFEENVGWRVVLANQIDLSGFQAVKNYANP